MLLKACGALALLLVLAGCDKLRALPGFEPAPAPPPPSVPVAMGPWLIAPLPGRVTVAWTTLEASLGRVWYGTAEPDRLAMEEGAPVTDHRVVLPSLQPSTQYRYPVEGGHETAWFTSAPQPDGQGPIHVVVSGDNRTNDGDQDRKSTRLNSSHLVISYAVFCLKKKKIGRAWSLVYVRSRCCRPLLRSVRRPRS